MKTESAEYSILIVTWKGDDLLRGCLESLRAALPQCPPCVVVDNANSESARRLCAGFDFVTYVPSDENLGFAGGNNLGLPFCKTKYVCLLNDDTVVHSDSFAPLLRFLEAHPCAAVAQGTMRLPRCGGALDDCGAMLKWYGVQHHRYFMKTDPGNLAPAKVFAAKGAFMMIRRSAVETLGGVLFHAHFRNYYEETDFCHRVWLSGSEVWFVPTPPVDHLLGSTSSKFRKAEIWRQYMANIFFSFLANFSLEGKIRILIPFSIVYAAYTLLCLLKGDFALFRAMLSVPAANRRRSQSLADAASLSKRIRRVSDRDLLKQVMC